MSLHRVRMLFENSYVRLSEKAGKYAGRTARITDITLDNEHGFLFLCMVQRKSENVALNSDGESRSYRPIDHIILFPGDGE